MSLLKNNTSYEDLSYTIKRLSAIPVGNVNYDILQYTRLTKAAFKMLYPIEAQGTILIRAFIPTDVDISDGAYGYFFGMKYPSGQTQYNQWIGVKNISGTKKVVWGCGNIEIIGPALDGMSHDYGFVGGYAVMDNKKVSESQSTPVLAGWTQGCVGGMYNGSYAATLYFPDIYIQRFDLMMYASTSPEEWNIPYLCRYYPVGNGQVYNAMRLVQALYSADVASGGSTAAGPVLEKPYGIQLDDLKYLTGSGYKNLIPLVCCDGGVDERMHPQSPEGAYTGIAGHYFAFDLSDTDTPSGPTPPPLYPYMRGKLSAGRKPLGWDIWNDCIDRGFYVRNDNGTYKLEFNIFKKSNGLDDDEVHLDMFEGYNTDPSCVHLPTIQLTSDNVTIPYHNGMNYECTKDNMACGHLTILGELDGPDFNQLFFVRNVGDFTFKCTSGNTIPWNVPKAHLQANPNCLYYVYGIGTQLVVESDVMASSVEKETKYMCADNHTAQELEALKEKYMVTGVGGTLVLNYLEAVFRNKLLAATNYTLNGSVNLVLKGKNPDNNEDKDITMPDFMDAKSIQVVGQFNPKLYSDTSKNGRKFVSENLASGKNLAYNELIRAPYAAISGDPKILLLQAHECNAEGTALADTADDYYAFVTLQKATSSAPNVCDDVTYALVAGRKFAVNSSTNPYTAGTVNHAIYQYTYDNINVQSYWYRGAYQIGNTEKDANTIHFALSTQDLTPAGGYISFNEADLDYANLRYDIFNAARHPRVARFDGTYIPVADTLNMHGDNGCVMTLRTPVQNLHDGNSFLTNVVLNMYMQKYKWNSTTNEYDYINEGPDTGQTNPDFRQVVVMRKNGTIVAKFRFNFEQAAYDFVYNPSTHTYSHEAGYDAIGGNNSKYVCRVDYVQANEDFISPNGEGKSKAYYGTQWFYSLNITFKNSSSDTDYPKAGDVFDITFQDNV